MFLSMTMQISAQEAAIDLSDVRDNYGKAAGDKKICAKMLDDLKKQGNKSVYLAYFGGFQAIWASHVINPVSKLSVFKRGKENIEKAVANEPQNAEIRFIRLSVQKNAPFFLNYSKNVEEDEMFLRQHIKNINSPVLLKMVNELLKM